ncbi:MAG TPA: sensor histidine kinase [Opitutaceae bacterium]|nr:sensor histidine kinase [Opitutaceae bacterium]HRJ47785.1 sensor histidine kinase [Opitutaceae bacterium]
MSSFARLLVLSALLLGIFLAGALAAQAWLNRQGERLLAEAVAQRQAQFLQALETVRPGPLPWDDKTQVQLETLIDARVRLTPPAAAGATVPPGYLTFTQKLPAADRTEPADVTVAFALPPLLRLQLAHLRTWVVLLVLAAGLVMMVIVASSLWRRPQLAAADSRTPWRLSRDEMGSLEKLAQTSIAQGSALSQERDARQRTEQNLALNQRLLNQALEEKIHFGRDLHDGLIQSLYAVGLTLESAKPLLQTNPGEAEQRLEQCLAGLNGAIRGVREYIAGLAPDQLRRANFTRAVELIFEELRGARPVALTPTIDEDATGALTPAQTTELLQIVREAISNSLRHGEATELTVRLHRNDREIGLLVQDNGAGFTPATNGGGFGLGNMQARAEQLRATLRIDSQPNTGTRVIVTLPLETA